MNEVELRKILASPKKEDEHIEFKRAEQSFSVLGGKDLNKKSLYGYCVGLGNSGGGAIIFGVTNDKEVVGTNALPNLAVIRSQLYEKLRVPVGLDEFHLPQRVVIAEMPARRPGNLFSFHGRYLMRSGEDLVEMTSDAIAVVFNELQEDFSAKCLEVGVEVLDNDALHKMRELYEKKAEKTGGGSKKNLSGRQFLSDLGLLKEGKINNAALLLLGTDVALRDYIPNAEIIFEYRVNPAQTHFSDRANLRDALVMSLDTLWDRINARNFISQLPERLVRKNIKAFNEEVIREAINNAVVHRDYSMQRSVFVRQDNTKISFENPGGFISGITPANIYKHPPCWRNRRLAEVFEKIGLVERSGQGADLIFENNIREGKGIPHYEATDNDVSLTLSAVIKDQEIISYLDEAIQTKKMELAVDDLVTLERIKERDTKGLVRKDLQKFLDAGIVVSRGLGRGTKYFLAKQYYKDHDRLGEYTKITGLSRTAIKETILQHIRDNEKGTASECRQAFPNLTAKDVNNILQELKREGRIKFIGNRRSGHWVLLGKKLGRD